MLEVKLLNSSTYSNSNSDMIASTAMGRLCCQTVWEAVPELSSNRSEFQDLVYLFKVNSSSSNNNNHKCKPWAGQCHPSTISCSRIRWHSCNSFRLTCRHR